MRFVLALPEHARELAPRMRAADLLEAQAAGFSTALEALEESLATSDIAWAALFNGEVAVIFGFGPLRCAGALGPCTEGIIWSLTGDLVSRFPMTFFRLGKPVLEQLQLRCGYLVNWVDARYVSAIRWAQYLGFTVGEPMPYGPLGLPFCSISLRRS